MRICLVSREFAPYQGAGIGAYVAQMAAAYQRAGHDVHVLTEANPDIDAAPPACPVHQAPASDHEAYAATVHEMLAGLHAARPFDAIEFPDYGAEGFAALREREAYRGAVLAVRLHTPTQDCIEFNDETWLLEERAALIDMEHDAMRRADVLVSPCRSLRDRVASRLDVADEQTAVVHYPFDVDAFASDAEPEASDVPTVLYYGRIERRKGVDLLVDAGLRLLEEGVNVRFRFIGADTRTGPNSTSMRRTLKRRTPDAFVFEKPRDRAALAGAVRGAACCCFPSRWENFPNVCLEAMSLGSLVVGSDAGGMSEMIEDGVSGLLFESGSVDSLTSALRRALHDGALRDAARHAAPARIRTICDPTRIVNESISVFERARRG